MLISDDQIKKNYSTKIFVGLRNSNFQQLKPVSGSRKSWVPDSYWQRISGSIFPLDVDATHWRNVALLQVAGLSMSGSTFCRQVCPIFRGVAYLCNDISIVKYITNHWQLKELFGNVNCYRKQYSLAEFNIPQGIQGHRQIGNWWWDIRKNDRLTMTMRLNLKCVFHQHSETRLTVWYVIEFVWNSLNNTSLASR